MTYRLFTIIVVALVGVAAVRAQSSHVWVTSWTGSVQGPYPVGNPAAQPHLQFAFPAPASGARDQTFRLIVRPSLWGPRMRVRLSNAFGTQPVTFDDVFVGLDGGSATIITGTNASVTFSGSRRVTIAPGEWLWSDGVDLPFVAAGSAAPSLRGRALAVSFHVVGESGPMTWHAKAMTTSYVTTPGAGSHGQDLGEVAFPFSTTSWFFLDAVDMWAPAGTHAVVAFGDSITDGTASTMNGSDRWPDVLARRLDAAMPGRFAVVNAGIGGNQIIGPERYSAIAPAAAGPSAGDRLDRDVLDLSGVSAVIWLEGINDFATTANASVADVEARMTAIVARLRARLPGVRVIGATLTSALGSTNGVHGSADEDAKRRALNAFIRSSRLFDGVADFDRAMTDPATGRLRPEFIPESTTGGAGDGLHPNRAGYLAMGTSIDLALFTAPR